MLTPFWLPVSVRARTDSDILGAIPSGGLARQLRATLLLILAFAFACGARGEEPRWAAPPLGESLSIRDGRTDEPLSFDEFIEAVSDVDALFLGESHTDDTTHRFQLAVYKSLLDARHGQVVLAMEMFERDDQPALDAYLSGETDEQSFVDQTEPWSNYQEAYRPLIEEARKRRVPVVGSNFPRKLIRQVAMRGSKALDDLSAAERQWVPERFFPNLPGYWRRVDNAVRGHRGISMGGDSDEERLYSTQSLWDNAMGDACAQSMEDHEDRLVLHINGGFHSAYWDGAVHQLRQRKPDAQVRTVSITPVLNPSTAELNGKPYADFIAFCESRATNIDRGKRSVQVGGNLDYRLYLPERDDKQSLSPLLLWLVPDGLTAEEGMQLCRSRFGEAAAVAVIEPPYRYTSDDYANGGRWYWPDTFAEDTGSLVYGIERVWAYLMRRYPLDPDRVCVAGEGTGATVAAVVAAHSERMKHAAVALRPRRYSKVKDLPLVLPELYDDDLLPKKGLEVVARADAAAWWSRELEQYSEAGIESSFSNAESEPLKAEHQAVRAISKALGQPLAPTTDPADRQYLVVPSDHPRCLHWGRLQARWLAESSGVATAAVSSLAPRDESENLVPVVSYLAAMQPGVLPPCPGPFGGTTVVVLPDDATGSECESWLTLETNDPLAAASRFHRTRIASDAPGRSLPEVLEKLRSENRKNILIVPAVFFADLGWLRELRSRVRPFEDDMTLQWLPGLGGRKGALQQ